MLKAVIGFLEPCGVSRLKGLLFGGFQFFFGKTGDELLFWFLCFFGANVGVAEVVLEQKRAVLFGFCGHSAMRSTAKNVAEIRSFSKASTLGLVNKLIFLTPFRDNDFTARCEILGGVDHFNLRFINVRKANGAHCDHVFS